jgi:Trypsin-like peptidase domain/Effector-associated domain 1
VPWSDQLTHLNYVLASLYPAPESSYRVVRSAGIPEEQVAFRARAVDNWFEILREAENRGKLVPLIDAALKDHPENPLLLQARRGELSSIRGPAIGPEVDWRGSADTSSLERLMGAESTLLPISFLAVGTDRARSVARIKVGNGLGSGFLTRDNILVTCHHVLPDAGSTRAARLQFNYQKTAVGLDEVVAEFALDPDAGFSTSKEDDWTVCRVRGDANTTWGAIEVASAEVNVGDRAIIVQHPGSGPKQIAFYHNVIAFADGSRVQYLTDTLRGSSGSPVFDNRWRLIALHHSGGDIVEPGTKSRVFRNEGIHVDRLHAGLTAARASNWRP